jgi:hypothetical protein
MTILTYCYLYGVTTGMFWTGNWIYCTLLNTAHDYTSQFPFTHIHWCPQSYLHLPLLGSSFQASNTRCSLLFGSLDCPCASATATLN